MPGKTLRRLKQSASVSALVVMVGLATAPVGATETVTYSYDALGRLTGRASTGSVNSGLNVATTFDAAGNRKTYDVTGAVVPTFSIGNASAVTEGGALSYTVSLAGSASTNLSVNYATTGGTATSGQDYTATTGTLTFLPGDVSKPITVQTNDDSATEPSETVVVSLSNPSPGSVVGTAQGSGTINDNDTASAPTFSIGNAAAVTEGGTLTYYVTQSGSSSSNYSVSYATTGGSASSGQDYTYKSGTLTFAPGDGPKPITVATTDDTQAENPETVVVSLSNPSGTSTIATGQGTGTINDNDNTAISFAIGNAAPVSEGGTLNFYVTKTGSTASNYTVNYATANGSADGSDYTAKSGTLTFTPSDVSLPIPVQTTDDNVYEGDETVLVNLSNASGGATITTAQASGTIPGNDLHPPVTVNDTKSMGKCAIATINLTANDSDPDGFLPLKITSLAGGPAIHATIVSDSSIEFDAQVPAGQYAITYTVQDTRGAIAQATGTVTITVTGTQICN